MGPESGRDLAGSSAGVSCGSSQGMCWAVSSSGSLSGEGATSELPPAVGGNPVPCACSIHGRTDRVDGSVQVTSWCDLRKNVAHHSFGEQMMGGKLEFLLQPQNLW